MITRLCQLAAFLPPTRFSETIDANYIGTSLRERIRSGLGIIEPCLCEGEKPESVSS
jgi:hypothetical protein